MKIGIIIYSQTGNTFSVAQKLQKKLITEGHLVDLEKIKVVGKVTPRVKNIKFENLPDVEQYDALIFGSPVQAFSLSSPMSAYLAQVTSLEGKKVALLATQQFPYPWMGGNHTIGQMKKLCESKGAFVTGSGIINWSKSNREQRIVEVIDKLSKLFL